MRTIVVLLAALTAPAVAQVPPVPTPAANPTQPDRAMLGKFLFWDEQLSSDNTVACGTCHQPGDNGRDPRRAVNPGQDGLFRTPDDVFGSPGVITMDTTGAYVGDAVFGDGPQVTGRNSPTALGSLWSPLAFWDGRAGASFSDPVSGAVLIPVGGALEAQAVGPILNPAEMAHEGRTWDDVTAKLLAASPLALASGLPSAMVAARAASPTYPDLFETAFGDPTITPARVAFAIAAYERTLVADQTPYDAFVAGDATALSAQEARGLTAFTGTTCAVCHAPPLFTDNSFRNLGLRPPPEDEGRGAITGVPGDDGRFKVPSLRGAGLEGSFMHNGQFTTLDQVLNFYVAPPPAPGQDPLVRQVRLAPPQRNDVVVFLQRALTDPRVEQGLPPFDAPTLHATPDACADGIDNDGDGAADLADGGCFSDGDSSEYAHDLVCDDGLDNDGDGVVDGDDANCDAGAFTVTSTALSAGALTTFSAHGAAPGERVVFFVSTQGEGMGPCHPTAPICLDVIAPRTVGSAVADAQGDAVISVRVPSAARPGTGIWAQAAWFVGGAGDVSAVLEATVL